MNDDKKTDWGRVDKIIKGEKKSDLPSVFGAEKEISIKKKGVSAFDSPDGIVARFKAKQIERKTGLQMLKVYFDKEREVIEEKIKQAAHLKKKEVMVEAHRFLNELDRRQVEYFAEFGLKNVDLRARTMMKLDEQTAEILKSIEEKDLPVEMKNKTIEGVMKLHDEFFQKLLKELEELESNKDE